MISEISEDLLRVDKNAKTYHWARYEEQGNCFGEKRVRKERRKEMACNPETENLIEVRMLVFCFHVTVIP